MTIKLLEINITDIVFLFFLKRVESFLHKDVTFVVTENQDGLKEQKCTDSKERAKVTNEESQHPVKESILNSERRRPVTPRPVVHAFFNNYY